MYFLLLKLVNAMLFSSIFINLLRGLPFPRTPHFYSYMAFAAGIVNILIVSYLNISFTPVLMINQLFIFLFIFSRKPGIKRLAITLSIIPQLVLLSYLFNRDYPAVFRFFLLSRVRGNWFLSLFSLPVICMLLAQNNYHHHYERSRQEMKTALITFMDALLVISMVIFSFQLTPGRNSSHKTVMLDDSMNLDSGIREIQISSGREIENAVLRKDGHNDIPIPQGLKSFDLQGETEDDLLSIEWETRTFLDRRSIDLEISTKDKVNEILLDVSSGEKLVLYDSIYPYELSPDQKSLKIFIGINPPSPLGISLIFSGDSRPDMHITVLKNDSSYKIIPGDEPFNVESQTRIVKTLEFESLKLSGSYNGKEEPDLNQ